MPWKPGVFFFPEVSEFFVFLPKYHVEFLGLNCASISVSQSSRDIERRVGRKNDPEVGRCVTSGQLGIAVVLRLTADAHTSTRARKDGGCACDVMDGRKGKGSLRPWPSLKHG